MLTGRGVRPAATPASAVRARRRLDGRACAKAPRRGEPASRARSRPRTCRSRGSCVDVPLPHLDRPFDYLVPADARRGGAAGRAGAGALRRPAGRRLRCWSGSSDVRARRPAGLPRAGRLARAGARPRRWPRLARAVADRYAGTLADVLRLAVRPATPASRGEPAIARPRRGGMPAAVRDPSRRPRDRGARAGGGAYPRRRRRSCGRSADGTRAARAVWSALPGEDWPARIAEAAAATVRRGPGRARRRAPTPATSTGSTRR